MAALGAVTERNRGYDEIASEVRQFTARIVGPSLELLGSSIELLRLEGLLEEVSTDGRDNGDRLMRLTDAGRVALRKYLRTEVPADASDQGRLIIALKLRFIEVLDRSEQLEQLRAIERFSDAERVRLDELGSRSEWLGGLLADWLDVERDLAERRTRWCREMIRRRAEPCTG